MRGSGIKPDDSSSASEVFFYYRKLLSMLEMEPPLPAQVRARLLMSHSYPD